ncbi:tetratricopeptide repeat protein [Cerasicoccus fimbriatus]|uniref:tetratricopeptide repeat protein n=1 Tax=Cerasicoccus fimbriatus TaxID=3014554 RepID=UPI0022B5D9D8|nr:tetratricopeptide repeat protein [Cerasicoccus sp. TK19100]
MLEARFLGLFFAALLAALPLHANRELKADNGDQSLAGLEKRVAADPDNLELRYDLGIAYTEVAMNEEDEEALDRSLIIFKQILKDDPNNAKTRAMLGSNTVMKAQYVSIFSKLDYVEEGYTILDELIASDPNNPDTRLIRGINASRSPGFLGRGDVAEEDFNWLLTDLQKSANTYDDNYRRTIYYYVGDWYLDDRDKRCVELLLKASQLPGAPRLTDDIEKSLKKAQKRFPSTYRKLTQ